MVDCSKNEGLYMKNRITALLLGSVLMSGSSLSLAAENTNTLPTGEQDFIAHCGACHGVDGKGGLEKFDDKVVKPGDLTHISRENDGVFPYVLVRRIIDGRHDQGGRRTRAHMIGEMPVWGEVFASEKGSTASGRMHGEAIAKMRILNLVDYLVSIQEVEEE